MVDDASLEAVAPRECEQREATAQTEAHDAHVPVGSHPGQATKEIGARDDVVHRAVNRQRVLGQKGRRSALRL